MNPVELVLLNADIRTMDPLRPRAAAMAVGQGRVVALGENQEIRALANGRTKLLDAGGRLVLPGFQDTHIHLQDSGTDAQASVDLAAARTVGELQDLLRGFAAKRPAEPWVPFAVLTVKAEAAYFTSGTPQADQYLLWVLQLERQAGEWSFTGGYAGQAITAHGTAASFSPERGFTRALVARAGYIIDVNRSVAFETVIRQNGRGIYVKPEYTQAVGQHWRITAGFALIRGASSDFLGQYRRNSHGILGLRYSF